MPLLPPDDPKCDCPAPCGMRRSRSKAGAVSSTTLFRPTLCCSSIRLTPEIGETKLVV